MAEVVKESRMGIGVIDRRKFIKRACASAATITVMGLHVARANETTKTQMEAQYPDKVYKVYLGNGVKEIVTLPHGVKMPVVSLKINIPSSDTAKYHTKETIETARKTMQMILEQAQQSRTAVLISYDVATSLSEFVEQHPELKEVFGDLMNNVKVYNGDKIINDAFYKSAVMSVLSLSAPVIATVLGASEGRTKEGFIAGSVGSAMVTLPAWLLYFYTKNNTPSEEIYKSLPDANHARIKRVLIIR